MTYTLEDLNLFYPKNIREIAWNIDHETGLWLGNFVESQGVRNILELGTSIGVSASYLALSTKGVVTTIESNPARRILALNNFIALQITNITSLLDHAPECFDHLPHDFDFVFIDCIKLYYKPFTEHCINHFPKLRYIVLDNTHSHKDQLKDFFEFIKDLDYQEIDIGSGLVVITI
jgi:predicted O-methyltransferase YrrM